MESEALNHIERLLVGAVKVTRNLALLFRLVYEDLVQIVNIKVR